MEFTPTTPSFKLAAAATAHFNTTKLKLDDAQSIAIEVGEGFIPSEVSNLEFAAKVLDQEVSAALNRVSADYRPVRSQSTIESTTLYPDQSIIEQAKTPYFNITTAQQYYGARDGYDHSELDQRVNNVSRAINSGYLKSTDILQGLGKLDTEVNQYLQKSVSFWARTKQAIEPHKTDGLNKSYINPSLSGASLKDNFTLEVKTRDGDTIKVTLSYTDKREQLSPYQVKANAREIAVSYQVDGELSQAERSALQDLFQSVGSIADDFFINQGDMFKAIDLKSFDKQQLAGFTLLVEDLPTIINDPNNTRDKALQRLSIQYNVGEKLEQHHLKVNYQDNSKTGEDRADHYALDLTASLADHKVDSLDPIAKNQFLGAAQTKLQLLEEQIDFSVRQTQEKDKANEQLYKSLLREMLGIEINKAARRLEPADVLPQAEQIAATALQGLIKIHPGYLTSSSEQKETINDVVEALPDFVARFHASQPGNEKGHYKRDFNLTLSQKTETTRTSTEHGLVKNTERSDQFKLDINQQTLRNNGAQRVTEHTSVNKQTINKAQYLDNLLLTTEDKQSQTVERDVANFHNHSLGRLSHQLLSKPLNASLEANKHQRLLKQIETLKLY